MFHSCTPIDRASWLLTAVSPFCTDERVELIEYIGITSGPTVEKMQQDELTSAACARFSLNECSTLAESFGEGLERRHFRVCNLV